MKILEIMAKKKYLKGEKRFKKNNKEIHNKF